MKISLNYTGRVKLLDDDVSASLIAIGNVQNVRIRWNLESKDLPTDFFLVMEIIGRGEEIRTELKHNVVAQGELDIDVSSLRDIDALKVRLKVVSISADGLPMIAFVKDNLDVENSLEDIKAKSLLPVENRLDLGVAWMVEFGDEGPTLLLRGNNDLGNSLLTSSIFLPLVLPAAVERIFLWCYGKHDTDLDGDVRHKWKRFFKSLGAESVINENDFDEQEAFDELQANARNAAEMFAAKMQMIEQLEDTVTGGGDD